MNPGAIYSKSGKGVQEASGKTSLLKRADRAVLSAIDGRATLAEVAQKVGKPFDAAFEALINQLDKDGFVRAVSAGESFPPTARSGSVPAAKGGAGATGGADLDFTTIMPIPKTAPPKPGDAAKRAKEQESALYKARQEAEARAHAERERLKAEAEAKARVQMEAKARAEAEKKVGEEAEKRLKAEAEAKAKAAREAALKVAAEAKAKADAEKARLEAERARLEAERKAREEAERKAREEAERARREAEELRERLEEERKAREEAERKAREEEERRAREEAERKAREEAERRAREEAERKAREEEERRAREEEERARRAREEEERARRAREEEEERARRAHEEELERARREAEQAPAEAPSASTAATVVPGSLDTLMKDLDFFAQHDEEERQSKEAAERKERDEKARRQREEAERRAQEQAQLERRQAEERRQTEERRQAEERRRKEEENRRAQEEAQRRALEAEEARRKEAEERKAREAAAAAQQAQPVPPLEDIGISDQDLDMEDVRRDEALVAKDSRKAQREREREAKERERAERQRARERERAERERERRAAQPVKPSKPRRPVNWGRRIGITLFLLLAAGIGVLHIMPIPTGPYERAASEVFGHPVRISSAHLSLYKGVRLNLERVRIGETAVIASASAYPQLGSLFGERKGFSRIEVENATLTPQAVGAVLFAKMKGASFSVDRVIVKQLKIDGGPSLPVVEADATSGPDGAVRTVLLRGQENLLGKVTPSGNNVEFEVTASSFPLPVAPSVSLTSFAMKGTATRQGMNVASWGGSVFDGALNGVANVRWGTGGWHVDGVLTVRNINAAVFAPALLSEGRAEGTAKFSMTAQDPAKLGHASRMEGKFTVYKGVLGSFDLSRLLQTSGRQSSGRTQFAEMTGQGSYDRGAVALREVQISAGALNAGASADIAQSGALSGRIVADVKTATQTLRQTIVLGGTVKEPQVRN